MSEMNELQNDNFDTENGQITECFSNEDGVLSTNSSNNNQIPNHPKFGMRDKVGYAFGDFGCNLSFALITAYLFDFYTQYLGLEIAIFSSVIFFVKLWDAVNDPLMGTLIDNKRIGKKSKYKPWIMIGATGLVIAGALAFLPVPNASVGVKIALLVITYLCWDVFYTIVNVPYGALSSAITTDPNQRTSLSTWRTIGAGIGGVLMMILPMFVYDDKNKLLGERLIWIAIVFGVVAFFAYFACVKMTRERIVAPPLEKTEKINYKRTIKGFLKNRPLLAMSIASFGMIVFFMSNSITTKLLFQQYFGNAQLSGIAGIVSYIPLALCLPFIGKWVKRWGKKKVAALPLIISIIAALIMLLLPMKQHDTASTIMYIVGLAFVQLGGGCFTIICWAMITDCIDYQEWKSGVREEGSVYAMYSLVRKIAQGVSASLVPMCLVWVGYNAKIKPITNQVEGVPENMKNMSIGLMLIGAVIMFIALLLVYNLDKKKEAEMSEALGRDVKDVDVNEILDNRNE